MNKSLVKNGEILADNDVLRVASFSNGDILGVVNVERLKTGTEEQKNVQNIIVENSKHKFRNVEEQEGKKKSRKRPKANIRKGDDAKMVKYFNNVDKKNKLEKLQKEKCIMELEIGRRQQLLEENEPGDEPEHKEL